MKYKLKRDLPWAKAGTVWEETFIGDIPDVHTMESDGMAFVFPSATFSDWFEEVDERWKPETGDVYFILVGLEVEQRTAHDFCDVCDEYAQNGQMFRTEALARMAAEQIKALLKEFHKNNP